MVLILGCDDDQNELARHLKSSGLKLRLVQSSEELLYVAKSISPDVILINILKSPFNFEVCRSLKSDPLTSISSIVIVSRDSTREDRLQAMQLGVDDFISPPVDWDEVMIRLRNTIVKTRQARELKLNTRRIQQLEEARAELTQLMVRDMKTPLTGLADLLELAGGATPK